MEYVFDPSPILLLTKQEEHYNALQVENSRETNIVIASTKQEEHYNPKADSIDIYWGKVSEILPNKKNTTTVGSKQEIAEIARWVGGQTRRTLQHWPAELYGGDQLRGLWPNKKNTTTILFSSTSTTGLA